jgi:hypothetical protein
MYAMTHIASSLAAPPFPKGSGTYALDVPTPPTTPNVDAQAWVFVADAEKWVGDSRLVPDDVFQWAKNGGQGETYSQGRYWYVVRGSQSGSQDPFTIYGPIYIYRSQVMSQGGLAGCPMGVECVTDKLHGGTTGRPQLARTHTHQPMQHDSDHWVEVSIHDVPVGVRTMLQPGSAWKAFRTTGTHQRWWGVGPDGKYHVHLSHGGVDALGAPGLGADLTGAQAPCCPSNATWGVAAAIFVGAGMITWAIAAKHKGKHA